MYSRPLLSLRASYALGSNKTDERFLRKNNSGQALAIPLRVAITFSALTNNGANRRKTSFHAQSEDRVAGRIGCGSWI